MTRTEREHYWREHVSAALSHPQSLRAYCLETELCYQSLLNWKRRLASPRFVELAPPAAPSIPSLRIELGTLILGLSADCPPRWAAQFVAALESERAEPEARP